MNVILSRNGHRPRLLRVTTRDEVGVRLNESRQKMHRSSKNGLPFLTSAVCGIPYIEGNAPTWSSLSIPTLRVGESKFCGEEKAFTPFGAKPRPAIAG